MAGTLRPAGALPAESFRKEKSFRKDFAPEGVGGRSEKAHWALFLGPLGLFFGPGGPFFGPNPSGRISQGGRNPFACRGKWSPENPSGRILWRPGAQVVATWGRRPWWGGPALPRMEARRTSRGVSFRRAILPAGILPGDLLPEGFLPGGRSPREARSSSPASQLQLPGRRRSSRELEPCLRCGSGSTAPEHWGEAWLKQSGGSGLGPVVLICNQIGAFPAFSGFPHHERAL